MRDRDKQGVPASNRKTYEAAKLRRQNARRGLQVVQKTFNGIQIGYVIGWWRCKSRWNSGQSETFQSYRQGVIYPDEKSAKAQRDSIETMRKANGGVEFHKTDD